MQHSQLPTERVYAASSSAEHRRHPLSHQLAGVPVRCDEVHVFDFDGTLFRSPVPHPERMARNFGHDAMEKLLQPVSAGGYGWFQDHRTLSPPYIPATFAVQRAPEVPAPEAQQPPVEGARRRMRDQGVDGTAAAIDLGRDDTALGAPSEAAVDPAPSVSGPVAAPCTHYTIDGTPLSSLFVEPVCDQLRFLSSIAATEQRGQGDVTHDGSAAGAAATTTACTVRTAVMTGRDETFRPMIRRLLDAARLAPDHVVLKPHHSAGTVKYKVMAFLDLVAAYLPRTVVYYEDRVEQGAKIHAGVQFVQWLLDTQLLPTQSTGWIDVENDAALVRQGIAPAILDMVPSHHRRSYVDHIQRLRLVEKLLNVQATHRTGSEPSPVVASPHFPTPPVAPATVAEGSSVVSFRFVMHLMDASWHSDSFLDENLEAQLYRQLVARAASMRGGGYHSDGHGRGGWGCSWRRGGYRGGASRGRW